MTILIIDEFVPNPNRGGSSVRMMQIIDSLIKQGHRLIFCSQRPEKNDYAAEMLHQSGIHTFLLEGSRRHAHASTAVLTSLGHVLATEVFDVAILCLWFWHYISIPEEYFDFIRARSPTTRILILTDEIHWQRSEGFATLKRSILDHEAAVDLRSRERRVYCAADHVLTIAPLELEAVRALAPSTAATIVPFGMEEVPSLFEESRKDLLLIGNFENAAMRDALTWFLEEIWPRVADRSPEIGLTIAGTRAFSQLPSKLEPRITCLGFVPDLTRILRSHSIFASPIRFGTGIVTKNVAAMSHGIPIVTTSVGARSLNLEHRKTAMICDEAGCFADSILELHTNSDVWSYIAQSAIDHVHCSFPLSNVAKGLEKALKAIMLHPSPLKNTRIDTCFDFGSGLARLSITYWLSPVLRQVRQGEARLSAGNGEAALENFRRAASILAARRFGDNKTFSALEHRVVDNLKKTYAVLKSPSGRLELGPV